MVKFFKSYRGLWEKQNQEMDLMTLNHNKQLEENKEKIKELENNLNVAKETIKEKNEDIASLKRTIGLFEELSSTNRKIMNDFALECKKIFENNSNEFVKLSENIYSDYKEKVKELATSRGGLQTQVNKLAKRKEELINENRNLRSFITRIAYESKRELTPPTMKELENYKLFGNKKGKRDGKIKNN